jgi:hypothetical protein
MASGLSRLIKDCLPGGASRWLRCSSEYSRYSRSSRLAIRAPRSGIQALFSRDRPLAQTRPPQLAAGAVLLVILAAPSGSSPGRRVYG